MSETSEEKQAPASAASPPEKEGGNGEQAPKKRSRIVVSKSAKKLLINLLKRLGLTTIAEIIPYLGDVAPGWTVASYLHLKDSPNGFVSPMGLIMFPLAVLLDAIGLIILCFGLDDFWITDAIGLVFIGGLMIFSTISQVITESLTGGENAGEENIEEQSA
jgi:hypothetical protein